MDNENKIENVYVYMCVCVCVWACQRSDLKEYKVEKKWKVRRLVLDDAALAAESKKRCEDCRRVWYFLQ